MDKLLVAIENKQNERGDAIVSQMSADDWGECLGKVNLSDTRSIFGFLARSEGRGNWGFAPAVSEPLADENGTYVISQEEKTRLLASAVRTRLTIQEAAQRSTSGEGDASDTDAGINLHLRPLGPFRERIDGENFQSVTRLEVQKSVNNLAGRKTPGPDGLPGEIFERLSSLIPPLQVMLNAIYYWGNIPKSLRRLHVVLIRKPGKDSQKAENRIPSSLLDAIMNIMEGIVYHRILLQVEPQLFAGQYFYGRARGAEHHLVSLMDASHRALLRGQYVYVVSCDVAGAFDTVSHLGLVEALKTCGINGYTRRLIHNWIGGRTFVVENKTPQGTFLGSPVLITSGLPQKGALSPLLWLIFYNDIHKELDEMRRAWGDDTGAYRDFIFAGDITTVITAPTEEILPKRANANAKDVQTVMERRLLSI